MRHKRLLILGGNRFNVQGIRAAKDAGFRTIVADGNPNSPGFDVADQKLNVDLLDLEGLQHAIEQLGGIDGIVSMAEVGVRTAAELCCRLDLPSISRDAAAAATSKATMRRRWESLGAYSPAFRIVNSEDSALDAADQLNHYPLISKPDISFGGSRGVRRIENRAEVLEAFRFSRESGLAGSEVVIERCVKGTEYSAEVLVCDGQVSVLCIGQKVKSPPPYRVDLSVQYPAEFESGVKEEVGTMCQLAVKSLGITQGACHVEFALTPDGLVLFELGARCGGGHTPQIAAHVSGVDEFVECCRMACGLPPSQLHPTASRGADYRFLVFPPGVPVSVSVAKNVAECKNILDVGVTITPQKKIEADEVKTTSDRLGFVVAIADSRAESINFANWASSEIRVHYQDMKIHPSFTLSELTADKKIRQNRSKSPLVKNDIDQVVGRYRRRIIEHGVTLASMASGDAAKQALRHRIHATAILGGNQSVLDIGCGLGCFLSYLRENSIECKYTGYDIVPEYIDDCQLSFPGSQFHKRNIFEDGIDGQFDTIVLSQVLNNNYSFSDNLKVMRTAMEVCYSHARSSVSIDMMSSYVDYKNPDLFYYCPTEIFQIAKSIARRVLIRHDYRPYEFCVQLFHEDAPGFIS